MEDFENKKVKKKSLGKVKILSPEELTDMFKNKPGDSGILVGMMMKYMDGFPNIAGAGVGTENVLPKDVMFLAEVVDIEDSSSVKAVTIKQYNTVSFNGDFYTYYKYPINRVVFVNPNIEQFVSMSKEIVYVENGEAYVDESRYAGVYVVLGNKNTKKDDGTVEKEVELNGVFCERPNAEKLGNMLLSFGEINGISYSGYEIREMLVL